MRQISLNFFDVQEGQNALVPPLDVGSGTVDRRNSCERITLPPCANFRTAEARLILAPRTLHLSVTPFRRFAPSLALARVYFWRPLIGCLETAPPPGWEYGSPSCTSLSGKRAYWGHSLLRSEAARPQFGEIYVLKLVAMVGRRLE